MRFVLGILILAIAGFATARDDGPRAALSGRVLDRDGKPLAGADVAVFPSWKQARGDPQDLLLAAFTFAGQEDRAVARVRSAADGTFVAPGLPVGTYSVRATRADRLRTLEDARVGGPFARPLTLVLLEGTPLTGAVIGDGGHPIAGARVAFVSAAEGAPAYERDYATCGADGRFRAVVTNAFAIATADGYVEGGAEHSIFEGAETRIVLRRAGRVEVTVVDRDTDAPVAGARIMLESGALQRGTTDDRGRAVFAASPGRIGMMVVHHPHYAGALQVPVPRGSPPDDLASADGLDRPVEAGKTIVLRVRLAKGLALKGRVLSIEGAPIAGATLRTAVDFGRPDRFSASYTSGADGSFTWPGLRERDVETVDVSAVGWVRAREADGRPTRTDATVSLDLRMRPAPTIRGRVIDAQGRPVAGAGVGLAGAKSRDTAAVETDANGDFTLTLGGRSATAFPDVGRRPPTAAESRVTAGLDLVEGSSGAIEPPASGTMRVPDIVVRAVNFLAGRVVDPDGRPVAFARIEAFAAGVERDSWNSRWWSTPASGSFEFPFLPTGRIVLQARADGLAPVQRTVELVAGRPLWDVELRLRTAYAIRGVVLDASGHPIAEADVRRAGPLQGLEGDAAYAGAYSTISGDDGAFTFDEVPAGKVRVHVSAPGMRSTAAWIESGGARHEFRLASIAVDAAKRRAEIAEEIEGLEQELRGETDLRRINDRRKRITALETEAKELR